MRGRRLYNIDFFRAENKWCPTSPKQLTKFQQCYKTVGENSRIISSLSPKPVFFFSNHKFCNTINYNFELFVVLDKHNSVDSGIRLKSQSVYVTISWWMPQICVERHLRKPQCTQNVLWEIRLWPRPSQPRRRTHIQRGFNMLLASVLLRPFVHVISIASIRMHRDIYM